ncbi:MAG: hypothetical protein ACRDXX_17630 [Stackebrandtia sp.]
MTDESSETPAAAEESEERPDKPTPRPRSGLMLAGVVAVIVGFAAAIVGGGVWLTGQWTPGSSPAEQVDGFLNALLVERDAVEAASYTCKSQSGSLNDALDLMDGLPESDEIAEPFTWANVEEEANDGETALVTAEVTLEITAETATWTFAVVTGDPDDTWRVCGFDMGE